MSESTSDWELRAEALQNRGGLPAKRAKVVALREQGLTYAEIAEELGGVADQTVQGHIESARDDIAAAQWLTENGPAANEL